MTYLFHYDAPKSADSGTELQIQMRLLRRLKMVAPSLRVAAVPNGARRSAWEAMKAKQEGLSAGFPDLIVTASPGLIAFLEIKSQSGTIKGDQIAWLNYLYSAGFPCGVFRSVVSAESFLRDHGFPFDMAAAA